MGLVALVVSLLLSFSGYVLRWDVDTIGALTVGTHIVRQIPLIGSWFYDFLIGGADVSNATLVRFYTWHILGLSIPVLLLIGWHLFRVRRDGGISHQAPIAAPQAGSPNKTPRISRHELVWRE